MRGNLLIILITVYVKLKCFYHLWCVHWTEIGIISHKLAGYFLEYQHAGIHTLGMLCHMCSSKPLSECNGEIHLNGLQTRNKFAL